MFALIQHLCCWLCCTILALPHGWCCMVVACCRSTQPTPATGSDDAPPPCSCCAKGKTCCGTKQVSTESHHKPEKKTPPERCRMCDREATKPKSASTFDLDVASLAPTFLPLLSSLSVDGLLTASDLPLVPDHPSLCKLHCVWTC